MAYALRYHPRVIDEDIERLAPAMRTRISSAIETRLATAPDRYGEPLSGALRAYRKLRVGDYRVVFEIAGRTVRIFAVAHRRDVYDRAVRRAR